MCLNVAWHSDSLLVDPENSRMNSYDLLAVAGQQSWLKMIKESRQLYQEKKLNFVILSKDLNRFWKQIFRSSGWRGTKMAQGDTENCEWFKYWFKLKKKSINNQNSFWRCYTVLDATNSFIIMKVKISFISYFILSSSKVSVI